MFRPTPDLITALSQRQLAPGMWNVSAVPAALGDTLRQLGWIVIDVSVSATTSKAELLDALAQSGDFPDHFGRNWDALADCLTDLGTSNPLAVIVRGADAWATAHPGDAGVLSDIGADTVRWYGDAGQAAYIVWERPVGSDDAPAFERL